MTQKDKRIERLLSKPKDYRFDELRTLLKGFGYTESNKGSTSGSRIMFEKDDAPPIMLHVPHNPPYLKAYIINLIIDHLKERGDI